MTFISLKFILILFPHPHPVVLILFLCRRLNTVQVHATYSSYFVILSLITLIFHTEYCEFSSFYLY